MELSEFTELIMTLFPNCGLVHNWHARTSWIAKFSLISFDINSYFMNPGNTSRKACVTQRKALLSDSF